MQTWQFLVGMAVIVGAIIGPMIHLDGKLTGIAERGEQAVEDIRAEIRADTHGIRAELSDDVNNIRESVAALAEHVADNRMRSALTAFAVRNDVADALPDFLVFGQPVPGNMMLMNTPSSDAGEPAMQ